MKSLTCSETELKFETPAMEEELASVITLACLWRLSLARHSLSRAERLELLELSPYINELLMDGQLLQRYFHRMLAEIADEMDEETRADLYSRITDNFTQPLLYSPPNSQREGQCEDEITPSAKKYMELPRQILAKINSKQASEIISMLPEELQTAVVLRIADVEQVSPEMLQELDDTIKREIRYMQVQRYNVDSLEKVVDMLNHFDRSKKSRILDKLDAMSPHLAEVIRKRLFSFEDIFELDDRSIQEIMREISNDTLTIAMKASTDDVKNKIFRNISSRAAEMMKKDLEVIGPVRLSDVKRAQSTIAKVVREMEEKGKIVFTVRGSEDTFV